MSNDRLLEHLFGGQEPEFVKDADVTLVGLGGEIKDRVEKDAHKIIGGMDPYRDLKRKVQGMKFFVSSPGRPGRLPGEELQPGDMVKVIIVFQEAEGLSHTHHESRWMQNWVKREALFYQVTFTAYITVRRKTKEGLAWVVLGYSIAHAIPHDQPICWGLGQSARRMLRQFVVSTRSGGQFDAVELEGVDQPDLPPFAEPRLRRKGIRGDIVEIEQESPRPPAFGLIGRVLERLHFSRAA